MRSKNLNFIEKLPRLIVVAMLFTILSASGVYAQDAPPAVVNPFDTGDETEDGAPPSLELEEETVVVDEEDDVVAVVTDTDDNFAIVSNDEELPETGPGLGYLLGLAGLAVGRKVYKKRK